jgi:FkbM family methyltransferase
MVFVTTRRMRFGKRMLVTTREKPIGTAHAETRHPRSRMHPAKIRAGVRRRWFEYEMERTPLRKIDGLLTLGDPNYGGWVVPGGLIRPDWVCYSVGAGGDISFDMQLIERWGVHVRSIDPVPDYVRRALEEADGEERLTAHQFAIATSDGPVRMQLTHDPHSESVSPVGLYDSKSYVEFDGRTLASLMAELGDASVQLLKLDIEGGEYDVIPSLDLRALGVEVFATQLHHVASVARARALLATLATQGYEPVACHPAVKLTFVRRELL